MTLLGTVVESAKWLVRIAAILPQLIRFWDAAMASDEGAGDMTGEQIAAGLELTRAMKRQQAKEVLES